MWFLLGLVVTSCQLDDSALLQPIDAEQLDTLLPDTVAPDYRLVFTGLFDIYSEYYEAGAANQWSYYTDSVRLGEPGSLAIPHRFGSRYMTKVDSLGELSTDYQHSNTYVTADGHYIGVDSFFLHLHMDVQPHTYGYYVSGKRH